MPEQWMLHCHDCGWSGSLVVTLWRCPACGGLLLLQSEVRIGRRTVHRDDPTLWRYAACLPVPRPARSLGEGMTPLVPGEFEGRPVLFKLDFLLPTGSFKDRGASVLVAAMATAGVRALAVDSSGNAAAAFSAYAALHGLEALVFAPAGTSPAKLAQARAYGAKVALVEGSREAVARAAQQAAEQPGVAYASHNWHPLFVEGTKTWLLEVWEQLGYRWPAACFLPVGGGSMLAGAALAGRALGARGPLLVAAQPEACAPLARAWTQPGRRLEAVHAGPTIAEGARIAAPPRGSFLLTMLKESGGWPEAIPEAELIDTTRQLWRRGLYVEPTAALGAAAFRRAVRRGWEPLGPVVILLTGSGLKASSVVEQLLETS